jgi:hypothetical protein
MKPAAILTLIFLIAFTPGKGQTHIQTNWLYQTTAGITVAQTFPGASGTGDLIVVHLDWANSGVTVSTVKDSKNNTYKPVPGTAITWNGGAWGAQLWYAFNITGTTAPAKITVTATFSGAPTGTPSFSQIYIDEYSGIASSIDPLDQSTAAIGTSKTINSGSKTTLYANELVYGASIGASAAISAGAGFNSRNTNNSNVIEDENVAAIGSYSASFTGAATGNWVAQMATFISTNSILPVIFSSFTGECDNAGRIALNWTTASENNNEYFTIQESTNGDDWANIGTVNAVGNSAVPEDYSYAAQPGNGSSSYFRIQQTDLNGNFTYSTVIGVNSCTMTLTAAASVYPNPITGSSLTGRITLEANETYTIEVVNIAGRVIARSQIAQPEFRVDLPTTLPAGVYYARIVSTGQSSVTSFLVR